MRSCLLLFFCFFTKIKGEKVERLLDGSLQPNVTIVESGPATKSFNSISLPEGSPWCDGKPTFWLVGHQTLDESPYCEMSQGNWEMNENVSMAEIDLKHYPSGKIDRHACLTFDINRDGAKDIICGFGATKGTESSYVEIYLTNKATGGIEKVDDPSLHGLHLPKYLGMRHRITAVLKDFNGKDRFIFLGTNGKIRTDGISNAHRMFRHTFTPTSQEPWFKEVPGAWLQALEFEPSCAVAADLTRKGADDLIICNPQGKVLFFRQTRKGSFRSIALPNKGNLMGWVNARVEDVTSDGLTDLIVSRITTNKQGKTVHRLLIFRGISSFPFFDFNRAHYAKNLPDLATDVEVFDVNNDGWKDIYVVQHDTNMQSYCGTLNGLYPQTGIKVEDFWGGGTQPPDDWIPPPDKVHDILLLGQTRAGRTFQQVFLEHEIPGCSWYVHKFNDRAMILSKSDGSHAGFNAFLEWL